MGLPGRRTRRGAIGHAEIDQPRTAQLVDQDVFGLEVLVDNAAPVRVVQGGADVGRPGRRLPCRRRRLVGELLQVPAPHELHHHERAPSWISRS